MRVVPILLACGVFGFVAQSHAFVFYLVGTNPLRWNVNSTAASTNVVNPVTKKIRYFIASDAYSAANKTNEINAIRACFDQWSSVPGSKLQFEEGGFVEPQTDTHFNPSGDRRNTNVVFWSKNNLSDPFAVAQVDKNDTAMIARNVDPSGKGSVLADVALAK